MVQQPGRSRDDDRETEHRRTLLVVDDDEAILFMLRDILEDEGYHVLTAADGRAAFALAVDAQPSLILTDLMMPHLDGRGLLGRLRAKTETARIPVVLLSAAGQAQVDEGFAAFIAKPFDIDALLTTILPHLL
jgi:CheY-like chemotaxis protein